MRSWFRIVLQMWHIQSWSCFLSNVKDIQFEIELTSFKNADIFCPGLKGFDALGSFQVYFLPIQEAENRGVKDVIKEGRRRTDRR